MKLSAITFSLAIGMTGATAFLLSSCNQAELAESKQKNDSLLAVIDERAATIDNFISSFNEVERNLDSVTAKQQIIHMNVKAPGEFKPDQKDRINAEIEAINNMMDENRKMIAELNQKLKKSTNKNVQFAKTIETLKHQLERKYMELNTLNDQLNQSNMQVAKLQTSVDTLTIQNGLLAQDLSDKTIELHTAYYVVGRSKELQEAKLIDKQGGLLGIGKTQKISSDFDKTKFTRIDYNTTKSIPINSSNVKIITSHPADSYSLNKDPKDNKEVISLAIIDPEKFWSVSKFLVVVNN